MWREKNPWGISIVFLVKASIYVAFFFSELNKYQWEAGRY